MPEFDVLLLYLFLQFYKFIAKIKISFFRCKEQPFIEYFKINANFSQKKKICDWFSDDWESVKNEDDIALNL